MLLHVLFKMYNIVLPLPFPEIRIKIRNKWKGFIFTWMANGNSRFRMKINLWNVTCICFSNLLKTQDSILEKMPWNTASNFMAHFVWIKMWSSCSSKLKIYWKKYLFSRANNPFCLWASNYLNSSTFIYWNIYINFQRKKHVVVSLAHFTSLLLVSL